MKANTQKIETVMANLDTHNRKNAVKVIAKAVALNIVVPVVAVVVASTIINHLNKD